MENLELLLIMKSIKAVIECSPDKETAAESVLELVRDTIAAIRAEQEQEGLA